MAVFSGYWAVHIPETWKDFLGLVRWLLMLGLVVVGGLWRLMS